VVTVATRRPAHLAGTGWGDTTVGSHTGAWRDLITGTRVVSDRAGVRLDELFAQLPVALLVRD
jgi:(1->4)-alpha-D-glucan 1-alpha-D-glucosylmutase